MVTDVRRDSNGEIYSIQSVDFTGILRISLSDEVVFDAYFEKGIFLCKKVSELDATWREADPEFWEWLRGQFTRREWIIRNALRTRGHFFPPDPGTFEEIERIAASDKNIYHLEESYKKDYGEYETVT